MLIVKVDAERGETRYEDHNNRNFHQRSFVKFLDKRLLNYLFIGFSLSELWFFMVLVSM